MRMRMADASKLTADGRLRNRTLAPL